MVALKVLLFLTLFSLNILGQDSIQTFLSLKNTGVEDFRRTYPQYDGRGTIIFILDTGVDMGVEGLIKTSEGDVKVIDVQDFTGQGNIHYYEAEIDEIDEKLYFINDDHEFTIRAGDQMILNAKDDKFFIGQLNEKLWLNSGSGSADMNGNGSKNDSFYFVVFQVEAEDEEYWVVYLDTDGDGDLSDERPIRNYKEKYDSFTLPNKKGLPKFTMALNILPEENIVSFVFDDGSHGTHCAGIAAGNRIGNADLFGVAPGAKIIGLKLGNNNYSGGATVSESMKNAYLYADKISREIEEPCIINMSFGIGSEIEGYADIELFLNELTSENPYLYICTSNGNEGPGLSTSGMPSASSSVFSTGAVLSKEVGNDLYSTTLQKDIILHFSSRGGEVAKPDLVAPGACVSTVPNFSRGDRFWGTSMASPYSAGVMALLLGAVKSEFPDIKIPSKLLFKVLRESAQLMDSYDYIDQGNGLINIEAAFDLLKKYILNGEIEKFTEYSISSFAPNFPLHSSQHLYIRDGSFLNGREKFQFKIDRKTTSSEEEFYRIFNLSSSADWLKTLKSKVHIRNNQPAYATVMFEDSILATPGLYNGKIFATRADKSGIPEFELMTTLVIPYHFDADNNYSLNFEDIVLDPGLHKRYFLKIPYGTSNLNFRLSSSNNTFVSLRYYLHDPDGRSIRSGFFSSDNAGNSKTEIINDLCPGVYELVILGEFTAAKRSVFDLQFEIGGINILGHSIMNNSLQIANYYPQVKIYEMEGKILGVKKEYNLGLTAGDNYEIPFELKNDQTIKKFEISLSKDDFNKVTDFALMIYDSEGKAKESEGMTYRKGSISLENDGSEDIKQYKLVLIPAFTHQASGLTVNVIEKTFFDKEFEIDITLKGKKTLKMFPDIPYNLSMSYKLPEIKLNEGEEFFSKISFISPDNNNVEYSKILSIKK